MAIPNTCCLLVNEAVYDPQDEEGEATDVEKGKLLQTLLTTSDVKKAWKPYLDILPTPQSHFDPTPDFWSEDLIRKIEIPRFVQDTLHLRETCGADDDGTSCASSLQFATWLLRSRGFSTFRLLPDGTEQRLRIRTLLVPYFDCLNHAITSNTKIEKVESPNDDESYFALVASRKIAVGDQLTLTYGTGFETSLDLFAKYGFWLDGNPNDEAIDFDNVQWSTSLEEDETRLCNRQQELSWQEQQMLQLRLHLKGVQRAIL